LDWGAALGGPNLDSHILPMNHTDIIEYVSDVKKQIDKLMHEMAATVKEETNCIFEDFAAKLEGQEGDNTIVTSTASHSSGTCQECHTYGTFLAGNMCICETCIERKYSIHLSSWNPFDTEPERSTERDGLERNNYTKLAKLRCRACQKAITPHNVEIFDLVFPGQTTHTYEIKEILYATDDKYFKEVAKCDLVCHSCIDGGVKAEKNPKGG
jgi:hypothetical protein